MVDFLIYFILFQTIGNVVKRMVPKYLYGFVNAAINLEEKIYITRTVGELLFDGYNDVFLKIAKKLEKILKVKLPMDKFGWFYNVSNYLYFCNMD